MFALISTVETQEVPEIVSGIRQYFNKGFRIVDVSNVKFDVNPKLFWVECPEDLDRQSNYYDPETKLFVWFDINTPEFIEIPSSTIGGTSA